MAPKPNDLLVKPHDWGPDRPKDWNTRRNVAARRDFARHRSPQEEYRRRLSVATHRLTRVLGRTDGEREVCSVVVRHVARCVRSRFATFAVPTEDHQLEIVATFG